jgi:hypothetical protein
MGSLPRKVNTNNLIDRIIDIEKGQMTKSSISDIRRDLKAVKNGIRTEILAIKGAEAYYRNIEGEYKTQLEEMEVDRLNEIEYNNQKRQLTEQILNDFNQLNQGKIKVSREPQETDDDFYTRLQSLGAIPVDQKDIDAQVQTDIFMKAKKNILELTSDLSKAETVVKMLNNDERFQMNKTFPRIKKKYSDTFGLNNKNLDANEITQFIRNELETGQSLITPKTQASMDTQTEAEAETKAEPETKPNYAKEIRKFDKRELEIIIDYLNADDPSLNLDKGQIAQMVKKLIDRGLWDVPKFKGILRQNPQVTQINPGLAQVATPINDPIFDLPAVPLTRAKPSTISDPIFDLPAVPFTRSRASNKGVVGFMNTLVPGIVDNDPLGGGADEVLKQEKARQDASFERVFNGNGLKNHALPSTVAFGKIALDLNKLFYQNVLSIKRPNGNKIIGHKNKRVSDNFVEIILKMFENKPITQSDLKNIKDEIMLYDNLIVQSGLHKSKKIPTNIEQTSEQMKNRLGLITGEIEAGNSNKKLLSELHELLFKMVRVHLISKNAATSYYKNIKTQFFDL